MFLFLPEERYALPQSVKGQGRQNDTNISFVFKPLPWLEEPGDKGTPTFVKNVIYTCFHIVTVYVYAALFPGVVLFLCFQLKTQKKDDSILNA